MPTRSKKTSRLNSFTELPSEAENLKKLANTSSTRLNVENLKLEEAELLSYETGILIEDEIRFEELKNKRKISLSRTSLLIQDYFEFKAARCIQRFVRGWLLRRKYKRLRLAAIKIQTDWRRFYCQRMYFHKTEQPLQQRIEQHFYRAAQIIQALWRGWWVRHHIHDCSRMQRLQLLAGEDLLYCVAFKLHHLLRTHQIPGVYSLRDSKYVCLPFTGPDVCGTQKCTPLFTAKDADIRMAKILHMYERATIEMSKPRLLKKKSELGKLPQASAETTPFASPPKASTFCGDVVQSMKKWKILTDRNLSVESNVFKNPQNVGNFLKDIESKMSVFQCNCNIKSKFSDGL